MENKNKLGGLRTDFLKGTHLDIFDEAFHSDIHPIKFYIHIYNEIPFSYEVYTTIDLKCFIDYFRENYNITDKDFLYKYEYSKQNRIAEIDYTNSAYLFVVKEKIFVEVNRYKVVIYYSNDYDFQEILSLIEIVSKFKRPKSYRKRFFMISGSSRADFGLELKKYRTKRVDIDIDSHYNDDFVEVNNTILGFLKDINRNGLVLLHGKFGTGKTTYLRYLMDKINRRFIFLPLNLMDSLSSPNFLPFISKYKESVLVIEDCEDILMPRQAKTGNNISLSNLLNIGDGLLSDAFSIKIICTFNANINNIDEAVLRKGRLVARYEFKELEVNKAKAIAEKIGRVDEITKPQTLADIYNSSRNDFGAVKVKPIGFGG